MKALASATCALVLALITLPALLASGDDPPAIGCLTTGGDIAAVLATIRQIESGGNYTAQAAGSSASGAYQFLDTTWNNYGGYRRAGDAPPAVQDAKAAEHVTQILTNNHRDVAAVPVVWYIGHVPPTDSTEWDQVPYPAAGNTLTPRRYQARWLDEYRHHAGSSGGVPCAGGTTDVTSDGWALPGPRQLIDANPDALTNTHAGYPAWDWMIPTGTPIYAMRAGTVTTIRTWPYNWWDVGCETGSRTDCTTCGIGLTITDTIGVRWTYCHGTSLLAREHQQIQAGQQIMTSGNTGRSSGPHLHIEIRTPDDQPHCPQPLLQHLYQTGTGLDPATLPTSGCSD